MDDDAERQNPYAPPTGETDGALPEADLSTLQEGELEQNVAATSPSGLVSAAAALCAVLGFLTTLVGVQFLGAIAVIPYAMIGIGAFGVFVAAKIYRVNGWAALAGTILGALLAIGMLVWIVLSAGYGVVSVLSLLVPIFAVLTAVFCAIAIGPCMKGSRARRDLRRVGIRW